MLHLFLIWGKALSQPVVIYFNHPHCTNGFAFFCRDKVAGLCELGKPIPEMKALMQEIQEELNNLAKNSKSENRQNYLDFLWSCYDVLPRYYVHPTDPTMCIFPDEDSFDCNSLLARLGETIATFLWKKMNVPSVWDQQSSASVSITLPDSDSKCIVSGLLSAYLNLIVYYRHCDRVCDSFQQRKKLPEAQYKMQGRWRAAPKIKEAYRCGCGTRAMPKQNGTRLHFFRKVRNFSIIMILSLSLPLTILLCTFTQYQQWP